MAKKKAINISERRAQDWRRLRRLIAERIETAIAESWSGGGDPASVPELKAMNRLAAVRLSAHIERMKREEGTQ